ncbi:hypothetical protein Tco_0372744, partial [Tanacetum coccineum]
VSEPTIKKPVIETSEAKVRADKPKVVRKNNGAPIIKDCVFNSEEEDVPQDKKEKKIVKSSFAKIEFVNSKEQLVKEGKTGYYQIIRADGSSRRYSAFIKMLRSFDREDLETLWKFIKAKHGYTRPEKGYERVL